MPCYVAKRKCTALQMSCFHPPTSRRFSRCQSTKTGKAPMFGPNFTVFFLEVAIATRANYFLGYGYDMGIKASAVSMITSQLRTFDGRGYWCTRWAFDPDCKQHGTEAGSKTTDALSYSC
mmetsp:Transcript_4328/g.9303  ORF Transcript_4328/g.9303 Transcript_4328/m.9303 type:complete len:120 (-) Transcript_4328:3-362(-)